MHMIVKPLKELTEGQLNWAVGSLERRQIVPPYTKNQEVTGELIDRELITTEFGGSYWTARIFHQHQASGANRLDAALRSYVHSRLGDTVHVPENI